MKVNIKLVIVIVTFFVVNIVVYDYIYNKKIKKDNSDFLALTLDGKNVNTYPEKGLYKVTVKCKNAYGKWSYSEWKLLISDISGNAFCNVDFNTINQNNLNDYIIRLVDTSQGDGKIINENGYRYEGKNPNNYIWFNDELWRIIGVMNSASHGQSGKNLVKIIYDGTLGALSFRKTTSSNTYIGSNAQVILNDYYYTSTDGSDSGNCYGYYSNKTRNCNYIMTGIKENYRNMIVNAVWHLGGVSGNTVNVSTFYNGERGTSIATSTATTVSGYVGLIYPSDFAYSVLSDTCSRTTLLNSYGTMDCAGQSWLAGNGDFWTITPSSNTSGFGFFISNFGGANYGYVGMGKSIKPTLYLDSSVFVYDGDGSYDNPFIIGM